MSKNSTEKVNSASADFFSTWGIYRKIIDNNYMFHQEIYADVQRVLTAVKPAFSVLDLGCGDASCLSGLLKNLPVSRYLGVDLSAAALKLAKERLKSLPCPVKLQNADFLQALSTAKDHYDVIFCSFALHYLSTAQKVQFFQAVNQHLTENGLLLLIDTCSEEEQTLPAYLHLYCQWLCKEWQALEASEKESACEHIIQNDLPETLATLQNLAHEAGLTQQRHVSHYLWHHVLSFQR